MIDKFDVFENKLLPSEFRYPFEYLKLSKGSADLDIYPWWFIDANTKAGELSYKVRGFDGRNLIPFAKVDDGRNNIACFDGDDLSGNPKVHMLIIDGDVESYSFSDFSGWLEQAKRDAKEYLAR